MNFDQVTSSLAEKLENVDPGRIRLTAYHPYLAQPRSIPLKRADWISLGEVLNNQQMNTILYFEILDLPLSEIENSREVKVIWRNKKGEPRVNFFFLVFFLKERKKNLNRMKLYHFSFRKMLYLRKLSLY